MQHFQAESCKLLDKFVGYKFFYAVVDKNLHWRVASRHGAKYIQWNVLSRGKEPLCKTLVALETRDPLDVVLREKRISIFATKSHAYVILILTEARPAYAKHPTPRYAFERQILKRFPLLQVAAVLSLGVALLIWKGALQSKVDQLQKSEDLSKFRSTTAELQQELQQLKETLQAKHKEQEESTRLLQEESRKEEEEMQEKKIAAAQKLLDETSLQINELTKKNQACHKTLFEESSNLPDMHLVENIERCREWKDDCDDIDFCAKKVQAKHKEEELQKKAREEEEEQAREEEKLQAKHKEEELQKKPEKKRQKPEKKKKQAREKKVQEKAGEEEAKAREEEEAKAREEEEQAREKKVQEKAREEEQAREEELQQRKLAAQQLLDMANEKNQACHKTLSKESDLFKKDMQFVIDKPNAVPVLLADIERCREWKKECNDIDFCGKEKLPQIDKARKLLVNSTQVYLKIRKDADILNRETATKDGYVRLSNQSDEHFLKIYDVNYDVKKMFQDPEDTINNLKARIGTHKNQIIVLVGAQKNELSDLFEFVKADIEMKKSCTVQITVFEEYGLKTHTVQSKIHILKDEIGLLSKLKKLIYIHDQREFYKGLINIESVYAFRKSRGRIKMTLKGELTRSHLYIVMKCKEEYVTIIDIADISDPEFLYDQFIEKNSPVSFSDVMKTRGNKAKFNDLACALLHENQGYFLSYLLREASYINESLGAYFNEDFAFPTTKILKVLEGLGDPVSRTFIFFLSDHLPKMLKLAKLAVPAKTASLSEFVSD
jgi:hypothetical protein